MLCAQGWSGARAFLELDQVKEEGNTPGGGTKEAGGRCGTKALGEGEQAADVANPS